MVTRGSDGSMVFELFRPQAQTVCIAGTFNRWSPDAMAMVRRSDGWWTCTMDSIEPGDHSFQYVVDGQHWEADFAASGVELNGFGTWVSRLVVREDAARRPSSPGDRRTVGSGVPTAPRITIEREIEVIAELIRDAGERLRGGSSSSSSSNSNAHQEGLVTVNTRSTGKVNRHPHYHRQVLGTHIPAEVEVPAAPVYTKYDGRDDTEEEEKENQGARRKDRVSSSSTSSSSSSSTVAA